LLEKIQCRLWRMALASSDWSLNTNVSKVRHMRDQFKMNVLAVECPAGRMRSLAVNNGTSWHCLLIVSWLALFEYQGTVPVT
jgi:hypothetical protein